MAMIDDASQSYLTERYLRQWGKTIGQHLEVEFSWGTAYDPFRRMKITCNKCHQTLTCEVPETPEKIDWGMQKFGGLHRHDPIADAKLVKEVQDRMNAPKATALTTDFKPVKVNRFSKDGRRFRETN